MEHNLGFAGVLASTNIISCRARRTNHSLGLTAIILHELNISREKLINKHLSITEHKIVLTELNIKQKLYLKNLKDYIKIKVRTYFQKNTGQEIIMEVIWGRSPNTLLKPSFRTKLTHAKP